MRRLILHSAGVWNAEWLLSAEWSLGSSRAWLLSARRFDSAHGGKFVLGITSLGGMCSSEATHDSCLLNHLMKVHWSNLLDVSWSLFFFPNFLVSIFWRRIWIIPGLLPCNMVRSERRTSQDNFLFCPPLLFWDVRGVKWLQGFGRAVAE